MRSRKLVAVLLGVVGALVALVALVATRPAAYRVERKVEVAAPPEVVFGVHNDLRRFAGVLVLFGSPFEKGDPGMLKTVEGPAAGVGQSYAWSGEEAGKGRMTIEESVTGEKVGVKLEFVEPMASTATYALGVAGTARGSTVTWSMAGNHNFLGKAMGLFMDMDAMLGADLEKGLAQLKTVAEAGVKSAATVTAEGRQ